MNEITKIKTLGKKKTTHEASGVAHVIERLPGKCEALSSKKEVT
jgi:hypothetical protein